MKSTSCARSGSGTSNRSFWFHVDAAWGGYIRSLFCGLDLEQLPHGSPLEAICDQYMRALRMEERVTLEAGTRHKVQKSGDVRWADRDIYAAFLAMADADSTTVDPAQDGLCALPGRHRGLSQRPGHRAHRRTRPVHFRRGGRHQGGIDQPLHIEAVGPYIVEGSKPGAAALSCWLAHKTIPLNVHGHGQIVRTTLLSAKKLFKHLTNHRHHFEEIHAEVIGDERCHLPFTFVPLFEPDTNIVCFVARPMRWEEGKLVPTDWRLPWLNLLNELIYGATSIAPLDGRRPPPAVQPFFVSRTRFEQRQYDAGAIAPMLEHVGIDADEYRRHGLFVLRSTVMNPWYGEAEAGWRGLPAPVCPPPARRRRLGHAAGGTGAEQDAEEARHRAPERCVSTSAVETECLRVGFRLRLGTKIVLNNLQLRLLRGRP